jgi:hypothetical protein
MVDGVQALTEFLAEALKLEDRDWFGSRNNPWQA